MRFLIAVLGLALCLATEVAAQETTLWYEQPAAAWVEALPVGNGRMGAMVFGGVPEERIQFNEQTLWTGINRSQGWRDEERRDERQRDGAMGAYQPFGEVLLRFGPDHRRATAYRRSLDLATGIAATTYRVGDVTFTREVFASHPDRLVAIRLAANTPASLTLRIELNDAKRPPLPPAPTVASGRQLAFTGALSKPKPAEPADLRWNDMAYSAALRVIAEGGRINAIDNGLDVTGASVVTVLLVAATDYIPEPSRHYKGEPPAPRVRAALERASTKTYASLRDAHVADLAALFHRVRLRVGRTPSSALATDQRLISYSSGGEDPALEALLFQFGRYLLISSSRPGGLPANLQGLWNESPTPAWYSGYTTNINVEMNYWPAEPTNLAECHQPLFDWIDDLAAAQRSNPDPRLRTPHGWVIYSTNNPLGGNSGWALHLPGSAWLSQHLYEGWAFGGDRQFLAKRAYPHLKALTEMWDARLVEDGSGHLVAPDGWSPEHGPVRGPDGTTSIKEGDRTPQPGASYDQQIIHDLFSNFIDASAALDVDPDLRRRIGERRARLLGPKVGRWGQLQEWREDVDEPKQDYRHLSHLFAVYPGRQVGPLIDTKFADAARVTLDAKSDKSAGWSRAWKISLRARLLDGNRAGTLLRSVLEYVSADGRASGTLPNLFGSGPPFQIDANFGYTAGVAEMLVQSHLRGDDGRREIHLLPAIPETWASGEAIGLRARDGFTVDQVWEGGKLASATITSHLGRPFRIRYGTRTVDYSLPAGRSVTFRP
jgi:alpha-L-fucosidase 2